MKKKQIFIACIHDRHTDDKYEAFHKEEDAKNHIREYYKGYGTNIHEDKSFGDWSMWLTEDYYGFVQKVTLQ